MNRAIRPIIAVLLVVIAAIGTASFRHAAKSRANNLLISSVLRSDASGIRSALAGGADSNARVRTRDSDPSPWSRFLSFFRWEQGQTYLTPTALILAADRADDRAVEILLAGGANPNVREGGGGTPLMYAAMDGDAALVRLLVDAGATVNAIDKDGFSALVRACATGNSSAAIALVERRANVNLRGRDGTTALMLAAREGSTATVKRLIDSGADVAAVDKSGFSALRWARVLSRADIVKLLVATGRAR
jgi:ankyrin repeat protein